VRVGEATANGVVDDMGSSRSDGDKLREVVTGSSSLGRPPPARSILAVAERHGLAGGNKYDLIIIDGIPSSTRSN
jgi:hypothetical protein